MECPRCKNVFSKLKEILIIADRTFYCPHCWNRLISYPDQKNGWRIEEDCIGEKCKKL
jgi:hypothetical protein